MYITVWCYFKSKLEIGESICNGIREIKIELFEKWNSRMSVFRRNSNIFNYFISYDICRHSIYE